MEFTWSSAAATSAFLVSFLLVLAVTGVSYTAARSDLKEAPWAFLTASFAIFWTFRGLGILRSLFSREMFESGYWSWFAGRTWEWSATGAWNFLGILGSLATFAFVYAVLVSLTLCNVPKFGHTRAERRLGWAMFLALLALDCGWLSRSPAWLF